MLSKDQVAEAARALFEAELTYTPTEPTSVKFPDAEITDAYAISTEVTRLKLESGRRIKGHKVGLTSKAMRGMTVLSSRRASTTGSAIISSWRRTRAGSCSAEAARPVATRGSSSNPPRSLTSIRARA